MQINEAYYKNNPMTELRVRFKNLIGTELEEEMTFFIDQRSLHTVGPDSFFQWKFNMTEEEASNTFQIDRSTYPNDKHFTAEYFIDSQGNWEERGQWLYLK